MSVEKKGDDVQILRGYAAKFDSVSGELFRRSSGMREIIRAGFFRDALRQPETIHGLFNHDEKIVLGERTAGTMRIDEDKIGLPFEIQLSDSQFVRDVVVTPIMRGEVSGCSWRGYADIDFVEYDRKADVFELMPGGCTILKDVGPVTKPAYDTTEISARSAEYERIKKIKTVDENHTDWLKYELQKQRYGG